MIAVGLHPVQPAFYPPRVDTSLPRLSLDKTGPQRQTPPLFSGVRTIPWYGKALMFLGVLGVGVSGRGLLDIALSPVGQVSGRLYALEQRVNRQLYEEQTSLWFMRDDYHAESVERYCRAFEQAGAILADYGAKGEFTQFLERLSLSPEDKADCQAFVEELQANGSFYVDEHIQEETDEEGNTAVVYDGPDTYHYASWKAADYTLEKQFERFADTVLYRNALKTRSAESAKKTVEQIKAAAAQYFEDKDATVLPTTLLALAMIISFGLIAQGSIVR